MQQGVQTDATCNIQQCCVRLHGALVSVVIYFSLLTTVTLDIGLHVVGVRTIGVRTLRHHQIFSDG